MPIDGIVFFGGIAALLALFAFAVWLLFFTPLVRWCLSACLYGGLAYLAAQLATLPHKRVTFAANGGKDVRTLPEELLAKVDVAFTTQIGPAVGSEQFTLTASGTITNKSDRVIDSLRIWCRIEKLSSGDSEVASNRIDVLVRPGEASAFSGAVSSYLRGIIKAGFRDLQPPERRFCRVDEAREADQ